MFNIDPRQLGKMKKMMKKMGIEMKEIHAEEAIIRLKEKELIIKNPQIILTEGMGQKSYQITGDVIEKEIEKESEISEEDIKIVCEQAGVTEEVAKKALEEANGDLAEAIMKLTG
ncbi:MAG: nascent polypeptide-associated complex protein [Candidatus Hydrothermarchaeota archaeon]